MNIDCHVHITPPDIIANWEKYAQKDAYFSILSNSKNNKFAAAQDVVDVLGKGGFFDKAVVFGFAFKDAGLCRYVNDYVIESIRMYPQMLYGFCVVSPACQGAEKEISRCYNAGLTGVGELFPAGQGFDLGNLKETNAVAAACRDLRLPLLLHVNEPVGHYYPGKTETSLRQIEAFVSNNPGLDIILAHFGGGILFFESMKEIKEKFINVYYDTAAVPFLYDSGIYRAAKALGLCEKLLFGSDFPLLPHSRYMSAINESTLTDDDKKLIFGGNAEKIFTSD